MAKDTSLQELIIGYCNQVDGLVEPAGYGIYEVLLPDEVAARLGLSAHQRFTFSAEAVNEAKNVTYLHYGHALVDKIINELHLQTANGQFFINNVRPEKPGLFAIIEKSLPILNAKLFAVPGAAEQIRMHHYVRFNFKASLISDEKRELILPIWMDLQNGYAIKGDEIERQAILDIENQLPDLELTGASWMYGNPLSSKVLIALLERARKSAAAELGDTLANYQKRLRRFLELDRARLNEYYSDLLKDAERRLQKAEDDRRPALKAKLAAITAERQSKLEDVEQKYHLHIQLDLINLAIIAQPKLDLTVEFRKRTASVKRTVTWNPLLHRIEPLLCKVCGQSGNSLALCEHGHLAHAECLAPQCVECKRTFCLQCADQVQTCVVCDRPVCVHSLSRCAVCGRGTCRDHLNECHADNGQPRRALVDKQPVLTSAGAKTDGLKQAEKTETGAGAKASTRKTSSRVGQKPAAKQESARGKASRPTPLPEKTAVLGDRMEVFSDPAQGVITANVIGKRRELASRTWELTDEGLAVNCWCQKGSACEQNGIVYRPAEPQWIEDQVKNFLKKFQNEYGVSDRKVRFFQIRQREPFNEAALKLPARWKDAAVLEQARAGFEKLKVRS